MKIQVGLSVSSTIKANYFGLQIASQVVQNCASVPETSVDTIPTKDAQFELQPMTGFDPASGLMFFSGILGPDPVTATSK